MTQGDTNTAVAGVCEDCGEPSDDLLDGRCEDCDSHYVWCDICKEQNHEDDLCRHVYWSEFWSDYAGAGCTERVTDDYAREPIRRLLDACGSRFASWLYRALCFDRLCLGFWGPMLGSLTVENRHVDKDFTFSSTDIFRDYEVDTDNWQIGGPEEEAVMWLTSLWPDVDRPRWDTVRWIREWMEQNELPGKD
jgi:hypothetical protein